MSVSSAPLASAAASRLYDLQVEQLAHDESFHKDVVILPLADRIKHMALHNAKYVGYLLDAIDAGDDGVQAVLTDAFIITLATANTLNQDLGRALEGAGGQDADLKSLGASLVDNLGRLADGLCARHRPVGQGLRVLGPYGRRALCGDDGREQHRPF
jgi:hypothetical protein